jgi:hypothetical protein
MGTPLYEGVPMIVLRLKGQLGNQMFQYAAARTLADRAGTRLMVASRFNYLYEPFGIGLPRYRNRLRYHLLDPLRRGRRFRTFQPEYRSFAEGIVVEGYDERFHLLEDNVFLNGYFQSAGYFQTRADDVRLWFQPRGRIREEIERVDAALTVPPERRCAIHLRFGDYYTSDLGWAHPVLGWVLPPAYYRAALAKLPPDLSFVVCSDMPERARQWLTGIPNVVVLQGNRPVVDLFAMSRCRFMVLSNSTFAWWAAYLNIVPGKRVLAPKHFIGWWRGVWWPERIAVDGWEFLEVPPLLDGELVGTASRLAV